MNSTGFTFFFFFFLKLTYQSFEVEESEDCSYDAVTVYEDVEKEEEIGLAFNFGILWGPIISVTFSSLLLQCKLKFTSRVSGVAAGTNFSTLKVLACSGSSVPLMDTKSHLATVVCIYILYGMQSEFMSI